MNPDNQTSSGSGSLIGSIIVVIILIVGAIYLFSQKASAPLTPEGDGAPVVSAPVTPAPEPVVDEQTLDSEAAGTAADVAGLDADLKALDKEAGL